MPQVLVFANPIAGRGRGGPTARRLCDHLRPAGFACHLFLDKAASVGFSPGPDGVAAAIVIGGDGTLRSVAQWAIDTAQRLALPPFPLLIVPMGTANLMGRHLGLAWDDQRLPRQVEATLRSHRLLPRDVAITPDGIFLLMAGVGFDATVVHELARVRSGPIDYTKYVLPAIKAVGSYAFPDLTVTLEGARIFGPAPALAMVGNVPEYGTGFPVLPHAKADDGLLDVCVMPCASIFELADLALAAAAGQHVSRDGVVYRKGQRVRIESPQPVPVQVDGEPAGTTPLDVALLPTRIPFMVPA